MSNEFFFPQQLSFINLKFALLHSFISLCINEIILFINTLFHSLLVSFPIYFSETFMLSSLKSFYISEFQQLSRFGRVSVLCKYFC